MPASKKNGVDDGVMKAAISVPNFTKFRSLSGKESSFASLSDDDSPTQEKSVSFQLDRQQSDPCGTNGACKGSSAGSSSSHHHHHHHFHLPKKASALLESISKKARGLHRRHTAAVIDHHRVLPSHLDALDPAVVQEGPDGERGGARQKLRGSSLSKLPLKAVDLLNVKREGGELSGEHMEFFVRGMGDGSVSDAQAGALLMAMHLRGLSLAEGEALMKAMMLSGELLSWPVEWAASLASLQTIGSTGNKAKPVVAAAMAAIGLKFPILSSRGHDVFASILHKLNTIDKFDGYKDFEDIKELLLQTGTCIVKQPNHVAPAETRVRNIMSELGIQDDNNLRAACLMARVCAMKLKAVLLEVTCGPSEQIQSRDEAKDLVIKLRQLACVMGVHCKVILTHVDGPVGRAMGQSLGIAEDIRTLNGDGPPDYHELICKLGGHILHEMNRVDAPENGEKLVNKVLRDGSARKKFMSMLHAQGVHRSLMKSLFKHTKQDIIPYGLPVANFLKHLTVTQAGYVHRIDTTLCYRVMFDLARRQVESAAPAAVSEEDEAHAGRACAGGIQLLVQVGSFISKGECWAIIHHNVRLTDEQVAALGRAITVKPDVTLYDMTIDIVEVSHDGQYTA